MLLLLPEAGQDRDEYTGTGYTNCLDKTWWSGVDGDSLIEAQNVYQALLIRFIAFIRAVILPPSGQFTILNFESRDH